MGAGTIGTTVQAAGELVEHTSSGRYVRRVAGMTSGGYPLSIFLAGREDETPAHRGYDSACSWCWVGANHSAAAHRQATGEAGHTMVGQLLALVVAALLMLGAVACRPEQMSDAPAVETSSTVVHLVDVCRTAVDDLDGATVERLTGRCDYRTAELDGPCPEDALCAVQVVADGGDYPGAAATY
jgi:hypothetical protein